MIKPRINIPQEKLADFCRKQQIRKLSLFGSVLEGSFGQDSDIDVLVEFEKGARIGFIRLAAMELELSQILGRKTDLRTPAELSRYFREDVLKNAEVQYEKE